MHSAYPLTHQYTSMRTGTHRAYRSDIIRTMLIRNTNKHTTNNYTIYYTHYVSSRLFI